MAYNKSKFEEFKKGYALFLGINELDSAGKLNEMESFFADIPSTKDADVLKFLKDFYEEFQKAISYWSTLPKEISNLDGWSDSSKEDLVRDYKKIEDALGSINFGILKSAGKISPYSLVLDTVLADYDAAVSKLKADKDGAFADTATRLGEVATILNGFKDSVDRIPDVLSEQERAKLEIISQLEMRTDAIFEKVEDVKNLLSIPEIAKLLSDPAMRKALDSTLFQGIYDDIDEVKELAENVVKMLSGDYKDVPALKSLEEKVVSSLTKEIKEIDVSAIPEMNSNLEDVKTLVEKNKRGMGKANRQIIARLDKIIEQGEDIPTKVASLVNSAIFAEGMKLSDQIKNEGQATRDALKNEADRVISEQKKEIDELNKKIDELRRGKKRDKVIASILAGLIVAGVATGVVIALLDYLNGDGSASSVINNNSYYSQTITDEQKAAYAQGIDATQLTTFFNAISGYYDSEVYQQSKSTASLKYTGNKSYASTTSSEQESSTLSLKDIYNNAQIDGNVISLTVDGNTFEYDISSLDGFSGWTNLVNSAVENVSTSETTLSEFLNYTIDGDNAVYAIDDTVVTDNYGVDAAATTDAMSNVVGAFENAASYSSLVSQIGNLYSQYVEGGTETDVSKQIEAILSVASQAEESSFSDSLKTICEQVATQLGYDVSLDGSTDNEIYELLSSMNLYFSNKSDIETFCSTYASNSTSTNLIDKLNDALDNAENLSYNDDGSINYNGQVYSDIKDFYSTITGDSSSYTSSSMVEALEDYMDTNKATIASVAKNIDALEDKYVEMTGDTYENAGSLTYNYLFNFVNTAEYLNTNAKNSIDKIYEGIYESLGYLSDVDYNTKLAAISDYYASISTKISTAYNSLPSEYQKASGTTDISGMVDCIKNYQTALENSSSGSYTVTENDVLNYLNNYFSENSITDSNGNVIKLKSLSDITNYLENGEILESDVIAYLQDNGFNGIKSLDDLANVSGMVIWYDENGNVVGYMSSDLSKDVEAWQTIYNMIYSSGSGEYTNTGSDEYQK